MERDWELSHSERSVVDGILVAIQSEYGNSGIINSDAADHLQRFEAWAGCFTISARTRRKSWWCGHVIDMCIIAATTSSLSRHDLISGSVSFLFEFPV